MKTTKITFLGSGAWGTALAKIVASKEETEVLLYGRNEAEINDINKNHRNEKFFPSIDLPKNIKATTDLEKACQDPDIFVLSLPSVAIESVLPKASKFLKAKPLMVNVTKGFNPKDGGGLYEMIEEIMGNSISGLVSLLGPSFASDVMNNDPTCIAAVGRSKKQCEEVQKLFSCSTFRVYTQEDIVGAETACGMKNIIAIASGILEGLGYKDNARASLITRGLAEITRVGLARGANEKTFLGLAGVGDLFLTCSSKSSRNFSFGFEVGKANSAKEALDNLNKTVEGIEADKIIYEQSKKDGIATPIVDAVYAVLFEGMKPSNVAKTLMERTLKAE